MLKQQLTKYKRTNKLTWDQVAEKLGLSRQGLDKIFNERSPKTLVVTTMKIKALTGLEPWDYLDGLDTLKKIIQKNERTKIKSD